MCQGPALPRRLPQQITLPEALILKHLPKGTDPQAASGEQGTWEVRVTGSYHLVGVIIPESSLLRIHERFPRTWATISTEDPLQRGIKILYKPVQGSDPGTMSQTTWDIVITCVNLFFSELFCCFLKILWTFSYLGGFVFCFCFCFLPIPTSCYNERSFRSKSIRHKYLSLSGNKTVIQPLMQAQWSSALCTFSFYDST